MTILAVANTKGGCGKSTLCVSLAVEASRRGKKVLLVDADPQASSVHFLTVRDEDTASIQAVQITKPILHQQIDELAKPFDLVFIDTGGRDSPVFRSALLAADRILVPMVPSSFDVWSSDTLFEILAEVAVTKELELLVVFNQVQNTIIVREALSELKGYLEEHDARALDTYVYTRTAWPRSIGEGQVVTEWEPGGEAAKELRLLATELGVVS